MSDFVEPDVVRLSLSDGPDGQKRWIEVKSELTNEEWERVTTAGLGATLGTDGKVPIDYAKFKLARHEAWIVGWSLRDNEDRPVPVTATSIATMKRSVAREIDKALDAHIKAVEAEGNVPSGATSFASSSN